VATKTTPPIPRGISIRDFAESQGLREETIRDKVSAGEIPHYRLGRNIRIPLDYLETLQRRAYVEETVAAMPPLTPAQITKLMALLDHKPAPPEPQPRRRSQSSRK
jgi:excisionase family DNA binding protein